MNSDVMQVRIKGHETAQCCDRIRSCGVDSNMEDVLCEIETEKEKHLQETTEGHQFIESVSEVDHGKKLIDHSLNIDFEVCDTMERSETEIDEINYEKSTTNDVYSNKTIILTDLLHSTPVERDHEVFVAMEMSETEIDEANYERSTTDDMFSNETIILTDLSRSTPVERDHKFCDTMEKSETEIDKISYERAYERSTTDDMYSNETIILKDLSHSTPAERNHLSMKKSIHEETNVKRLVCNDTTCSLDEDNLVRVELEDSEDLSVDEFNITQDDDLNYDALQGSHGHPCSEDNDIADQNVFDYIRSIEISPDCRMVNGRETRNIPVSQQHNGIIEHSGQQESLAHTTNDFAQSTLHFDGDVSTQTTEATQNPEMTMEEVIESNFPDNIQKSATNRASSVPDQNRPAQRDMAEDLGINLDKPKYPAYAQLNVRVSTFQGWPGYLDQTPRDMALAGFFYAGYNDYCRCFFCGGGLRNWDSGDDPWVEHTRWFPKCAFVQQNRGRRFVEIIVKRQAEMQASGSSVGNTRNQRAIKTQIGTGERSETSSQTSSQSADSNSDIDPAKASVRELGYADEIIDRVITIIKQNNPGKQKIEATDIMEVIFTITEDSETNTAVASENTPSSELNLPNTRRAIPQSNVSSQSNQPGSHSSQSNKPQVSKPNPQAAVASQSTNASENSLPSLSVNSLEHGNTAAEIRSLQEENIQLKEQVMCKICMDKNVSITFLPCGHLACCIDCAPAMRKCPMCRVYIKGTVKTFLA